MSDLPRFVMCMCTGQCPGFAKLDMWSLINYVRNELDVNYAVIHPQLCVDDGDAFLKDLAQERTEKPSHRQDVKDTKHLQYLENIANLRVFDVLCGKLDFFGGLLDPAYVAIAREKLAQVEMWGDVHRLPLPRLRPRYNKKALKLELREIARQLGRLPTPEDVRRMSRYGLEPFLEAFPTWGKALKAAKLLE